MLGGFGPILDLKLKCFTYPPQPFSTSKTNQHVTHVSIIFTEDACRHDPHRIGEPGAILHAGIFWKEKLSAATSLAAQEGPLRTPTKNWRNQEHFIGDT